MAFTVVNNVTKTLDVVNGTNTRHVEYLVEFTLPDIAETDGSRIVDLPAVELSFDDSAYATLLYDKVAESEDDRIRDTLLGMAENGEDVLPMLLDYPIGGARRPMLRLLIRHKTEYWVHVTMAMENTIAWIRGLVPGTYTAEQLRNYLNVNLSQMQAMNQFYAAFYDTPGVAGSTISQIMAAAALRTEETN